MGKAKAAVYINENGELNYFFSGEVDFYVIDETCPGDRVYQMTSPDPEQKIYDLIDNCQIGHQGDDRHEAIKARYEAFVSGEKTHLKVIE